MDPEQRFLIVMEYLVIEVDIIFLLALTWTFCPEWMNVVYKFRTLLNFNLGRDFGLLTILICFCLFRNFLQDNICIQLITGIDSFCILWKLGKIDLDRHEGCVLINDLTYFPFVVIFQAVIIKVQRNDGTMILFASLCQSIIRASITLPVNWFCILLVR